MKIKEEIKEGYESIKDNDSGFKVTYNSIIFTLLFVLIIFVGVTLFFGALTSMGSNNKNVLQTSQQEEKESIKSIKDEISNNIIFMKKVQEIYSQIEKD